MPSIAESAPGVYPFNGPSSPTANAPGTASFSFTALFADLFATPLAGDQVGDPVREGADGNPFSNVFSVFSGAAQKPASYKSDKDKSEASKKISDTAPPLAVSLPGAAPVSIVAVEEFAVAGAPLKGPHPSSNTAASAGLPADSKAGRGPDEGKMHRQMPQGAETSGSSLNTGAHPPLLNSSVSGTAAEDFALAVELQQRGQSEKEGQGESEGSAHSPTPAPSNLGARNGLPVAPGGRPDAVAHGQEKLPEAQQQQSVAESTTPVRSKRTTLDDASRPEKIERKGNTNPSPSLPLVRTADGWNVWSGGVREPAALSKQAFGEQATHGTDPQIEQAVEQAQSARGSSPLALPSELRVSAQTEHLGPVEVRAQLRGVGVEAVIAAERPDAVRALNMAVPELQQQIITRGGQVVSITISAEANMSSGHGASQREQRPAEQYPQSQFLAIPVAPEGETGPSISIARRGWRA